MILPIPSILINNNCRFPATSATSSAVSEDCGDTTNLLGLLRRENSKSVHIHCYDSDISVPDSANISQICKWTKCVDIPISLFCKFESVEQCRMALDGGVYRIFIEATNANKALFAPVSEYTSSRVCAYSDTLPDFSLADFGIKRIMLNVKSDSVSDDTLAEFAHYAKENKIRITLLGGVNSPEDLWRVNSMKKFGIDSVVLRENFYQNCFPCQNLWRICEAELEPEIIE